MDFNPWATDDTSSKPATNEPETGLVTSPAPLESSQALVHSPNDFLLVIFIHGFKGSDETFDHFPQRLHHLLTHSLPNTKVECIVFPAYETKGELDKAIVRFADWLTSLVVEREVASGGGAGSAKIVLCGHSMGGLLAADSLREFVNSRPDKQAPLWPRIIALLAFDTPYLGLHPHIVKDSVEKAADHFNAAKTVGSALFGSLAGFTAGKAATAPAAPNAASSSQTQSPWAKWAAPAAYAIGGAVLAGAAAGGAYYARDHLTQGYTWATDHMKYVGNLWDEQGLKARVETLVDIDEQEGVIFRNYYTYLPPTLPRYLNSRTFVVLPDYGSRAASRFIASNNNIAADEIQAHTGMFNPASNDGYYELGLTSAKAIQDAFQRWRTPQLQPVPARPNSPRPKSPRPTSPRSPHRRATSPRMQQPTSPSSKNNVPEGDLISF
ncbi:hypothetical protein CC2G_010218 [Coprinopsis cinerea AmutBmut pab1-1]|nr:hypothetical protein CC2G_010218 [Coprinopsis cinerea AmutBmut pab1-1]